MAKFTKFKNPIIRGHKVKITNQKHRKQLCCSGHSPSSLHTRSVYFIYRFNKMLPKKHFDKIEKDAIDQISSSVKPITKEETSPKKVVEIKENALDKNSKVTDENDDSEYDYYSDEYDDDLDTDDIVTVTPKATTSTTRKCKCCPCPQNQFQRTQYCIRLQIFQKYRPFRFSRVAYL